MLVVPGSDVRPTPLLGDVIVLDAAFLSDKMDTSPDLIEVIDILQPMTNIR